MNEADFLNTLIQTVIGHQNAIQALIVVLGILTVVGLTSKRRSMRFAGCITGLVGQIFWFLPTYGAQQWGIVLLVAVYAVFYMRGVRNNTPLRGKAATLDAIDELESGK